MNDAASAGVGQKGHVPAPPAVFSDRRSNHSGTTQMSNVGSAVSATQMSRISSIENINQSESSFNQTATSSRSSHFESDDQNIQLSQSTGELQQNSPLHNSGVGLARGVVNCSNTGITSSNSNLVTSSLRSLNHSPDLNLSPSKKRVKLSDDYEIINDAAALEKAILEYKFSKLKSIKQRHSEHVAELYFLQINENMMEYPTWRKKSNTPQFVNFMKSHRLEPLPSEEPEQNSRQIQQPNLPHGAEIKIPGVGATPVAVSTTLPAAVVQLSQQGGTPLVPDVSADKRKMTLPVSAQSPSAGPHEQFSVKARQEVYVLQRVSELQREGLWMEKRLPKVQEPPRPKAHWDYLLEEMTWMATDFAQERKWKKAAAKKCARMVQKYFHDKALAAQKAEKAQELQLKRIASFIAKEIKIFWSDVEKLVSFKQQQKIEEKRKMAFDQHLNYIVDQTEKFSMQLVEGMNRPANDASAAPSLNSSRISTPKPRNASDDEFEPDAASEDDEETIAKAEMEDATNVDDEVAALQKESEMELDAFISGLPKDYLQNRDKIVLSENEEQSDEQSDEEFRVSGDSDDDEDTIKEQEQNENKDDHQMEIDELNAENDMTIDELMAKYKSAPQASKMELDSDDDSSDNDSCNSEQSEDEEDEDASDEETFAESMGLKSLLDEGSMETTQDDKDDLINDVAAIAESIQPKGNTLSSTNVVTPVPFLLKHTLREYQHIGLDWLVTMHDKKLNGILADEMGLGKTIQTISLLAHLACVKGNWGPHLIVVPSSVMLNWEMEFKKWCPGFKILTYYGTQKERKQKRIGWTKVNAFHICITSYKLVIQDHQSFRRKKWKYLILDEAQNIKNFKSQRWQLLLNFATEQRLLLTGTPLQNNLMELWSLMHFLMPHVFQSHRDFKQWFSIPMTGMIEGNTEYNNSIIQRLHKVLRPFLLRRLKSEVEKQMPKKYEHVVMCRLSNRQRYLYDDFMSRAKTKETLASGNLLSVINVLMQLRKVCNHPNMFETRPTISPFRMDGLSLRTTSMIANIVDYDPFKHIDLNAFNLVLVQLEMCLTAYVAYRVKRLQTPKKLIEEIDSSEDSPPRPPVTPFKMHLTLIPSGAQNNTPNTNCVTVGTSPAMKTERTKCVPQSLSLVNKKPNQPITVTPLTDTTIPPLIASSQSPNMSLRKRSDGQDIQSPQLSSNIRRQVLLTPSSAKTSTILTTPSGQRLTVVKNSTPQRPTTLTTNQGGLMTNNKFVSQPSLSTSLGQQFKHSYTQSSNKLSPILPEEQSEFIIAESENRRKERRIEKLQFISKLNSKKCDVTPIYGIDLRETMFRLCSLCEKADNLPWYARSYAHCQHAVMARDSWSLTAAIKSFEERTEEMRSLFGNFVIFVPAVSAPEPCLTVTHPNPSKLNEELTRDHIIRTEMSPKLALLHPIISAMSTQFPDPRLIQYDCGKLQTLDRLLRDLKSGNHRVLIFTQMTRMLDVLEAFLNYHGHIYLRLDGTTRIEQRQILMDRFNNDKRIFVFILSTRSGGVGVNLTGADTVIFYDSDWNPTMDAQAQDRCHRIGQTRDVHIYRLVSEKTIEENILKKANQKRLLGDIAIEGGNFTTAYFKEASIQDLFVVDNEDDDIMSRLSAVTDRDRDRRHRLQDNLASTSNGGGSEEKTAIGALESALAAAEDEQDVEATKIASAEVAADLAEFDESIPIEDGETTKVIEVSKAEQDVDSLLSPIERYAMRFVEQTGGLWTEQLRFAEAEIEQQKREWEANRLEVLRKEEEDARRAEEEENQLLTYSGVDARNQVNNRTKKTVNRSLGRNKSVASNHRRSEILRSNRRLRNSTPRSVQTKRNSLPAANSPKKRKLEETRTPKTRTISRSIPKRLCRQKQNSRSEVTDNDNDGLSDVGNASSNESKKGTSESVMESECSLDECSLDVMYDEQQSESNSTQVGTSSDEKEEKEESSDSDDEVNCSEVNGKEIVKPISADKRRVSLTNRLDINSPRTRSRGTVKLNLWALDDSPILPSFGGRSKRNQTKSQSNNSNDKSNSEMSTQLKTFRSRSNSPSDLRRSLRRANESIALKKRSRSNSQSEIETSRSRSHSSSTDVPTDDTSNKLKEVNESTITTMRSRANSLNKCSHNTSTPENLPTVNDRRKTITVMKLAQIRDGMDVKPIKPRRPQKKPVVKNGKSSSTLDSWLSSSKSAKIVLNKDDDVITKHLTKISSRTRRPSTLKINSENSLS